jgi:rfaE bifunctional protein kinase chain/domain
MPDLLSLLPRLHDKRIVVLGDLILDEYIMGTPTRVSREAPVVVLDFTRRFALPGGAASPACNVVSLGGVAVQVGVVGADAAGEELRRALRERGVGPTGLVVDSARPTIKKTRIVAQGPQRLPQHVARIDMMDRQPIAGLVEQQVIAVLEAELARADALLISYYRSGTISPNVVEAARTLCRERGILTTVDAQDDFHMFHGVSLFRCNDREAELALRRDLRSEDDFRTGLHDLRDELEVRAVVVTRGGEGLSLLDEQGAYYHIPVTDTSEVFDITGAGDTVIAVLTIALAAGANLLDAARLANAAAGVVVRKWGNALITPTELAEAITAMSDER